MENHRDSSDEEIFYDCSDDTTPNKTTKQEDKGAKEQINDGLNNNSANSKEKGGQDASSTHDPGDKKMPDGDPAEPEQTSDENEIRKVNNKAGGDQTVVGDEHDSPQDLSRNYFSPDVPEKPSKDDQSHDENSSTSAGGDQTVVRGEHEAPENLGSSDPSPDANKNQSKNKESNFENSNPSISEHSKHVKDDSPVKGKEEIDEKAPYDSAPTAEHTTPSQDEVSTKTEEYDPISRLSETAKSDKISEENSKVSEGAQDQSLEGDKDSDDESSDDESMLTETEIEERKIESKKLKDEGNEVYKNGDFTEAERLYTEGLKICPKCLKKERAIMYSNRSAALVKMEKTEPAIEDCSKAVELHPAYVKAFLRRAQLYENLEKYEEAMKDYEKVLELDPSIHTARAALLRLPEEIEKRNEKLKAQMMSSLKDLGNLFLRPFGLSTDNFQMQQDANTGSYNLQFNNAQANDPGNGK